jgi:O-antigen ligase
VIGASIFHGVGAVGVVAVAAAGFVLARRSWTIAVTVAVAADMLTWAWSQTLEDIGNVVYWGSVVGIGLELLRLALARRVARMLVLGTAAVTVVLAATAVWSLAPHTTLRATVTFTSALVVVSFVLAHGDFEAVGDALAPVAPWAVLLTFGMIVVDHSAAVRQGGGAGGFLNGPNTLGILLAMTLPFTLVHPLLREHPVVAVAFLGISAFVMTLSGSRTGVGALVVAIVAMDVARRSFGASAVAVATVAAAAAIAIVWTPDVPTLGRPLHQSQPGQAAQLLGEGRSAGQSLFSGLVGARDEGWKEAARLLSKRPAGGHGFGTGGLIFDHYHSRRHFRYFVGRFATGTNPHDTYLQELLELGFPLGLLLLTPALAAGAVVVRRLVTGGIARRQAGFAAVAVSALAVGVFESVFVGYGVMTLLSWLAFGCVLRSFQLERRAGRGKTISP